MKPGTKILIQLGLLLAITGLIGSYAFFGVFKKEAVALENKAIDERIFKPVAIADVPADGGAMKTEFTQITVVNAGQRTVLERAAGGVWKMVSPVKAEVDALVVDALTSQLQQAKFKATLEESPSDEELVKYGLKPPQFSVEATAGSHTVKLEGGIENTFDGSVYMRRDEKPAVYSAEGGVRWALAKSPFDLRRKEPMAFEETALKTLEVTAKNNSYRLERNAADKSWQLTKPMNTQADATIIAGLLGSLRSERALSFIDGETVARKRVAEAVLTMNDGKTVRLDFGVPAAPGGKSGYVAREDEYGVSLAEIALASVTTLDRNPLDLRDKTLVVFKKEAVTNIVFHNADGSELQVVSAASDAGMASWSINGAAAKTFKVTSVIWLLGTLKGSAFASENPKDLAKYGLEGRTVRFVAVHDAAGKELARLSIGKEVPNKPQFVYVRGSRPQVIEVDGSRFIELPAKAADLLELVTNDAGR